MKTIARVAALALIALIAFAAPVAAQEQPYVGVEPPEVAGVVEDRPAAAPEAGAVSPAAAERTQVLGLAVTGGDVVRLALLGFGAVAVGVGLRRAGRRPAVAG